MIMTNQQAAQGTPADNNSFVAGIQNRLPWEYHDTLTLAAGATVVTSTPYNLFAVGLGQPDPYNGNAVKTKTVTNLPPPGGQFPITKDMVLKRFGFYFVSGCALSDIQAICQNSYYEFSIDEKIFAEGLLPFQVYGAGITGYSTQSGDRSWLNGSADPHAVRGMGNYAKYIAPQMPFSIKIYFTSAITLAAAAASGTGVLLVAVLDGLGDKVVQ